MIKYSFILSLSIALVSCSIDIKHDSVQSDQVNYEEQKLILISTNDN